MIALTARGTVMAWKGVAAGVGLLVLAAGYEGIKERGRLEVLLQQADSTHRADSLTSLAEHAEHLAAVAKADELRRLARAEVKKDSVQHMHTDSIVRASASERATARAVLADSLASVGRLRAALASVVRQAVQDSSGFAAEREQAQRTILSLQRADTVSQKAIAAGITAEATAIRRAIASERTTALLKAERPSVLSRCGVSVGYGLTAALGGTIGHGPTVLAGCKVWP